MDSPNEKRTFLVSAQVATRLGVTPAAVRALARAGHLPVAGTAGETRLFAPEDVERLARLRARRMRRR